MKVKFAWHRAQAAAISLALRMPIVIPTTIQKATAVITKDSDTIACSQAPKKPIKLRAIIL